MVRLTAVQLAILKENTRTRLAAVSERVHTLPDVAQRIRQNLAAALPRYYSLALPRHAAVRTLADPSRFYSITDVYFPLSIAAPVRPIQASSYLHVAHLARAVLLLGAGGSGKSTLLNHLFVSALLDTPQFVPIHADLRRFDIRADSGGPHIEAALLSALHHGGFTITPETLRAILSYRGTVLFLDGFDEVKARYASILAGGLEFLIEAYPNCRFMITSRPHDRATGWRACDAYWLEPLQPPDYRPFLNALPLRPDLKGLCLDKLDSGAWDEYADFLGNPLLATLFFVTFGQWGDSEPTRPSFFDHAYQTLFYKHDAGKTGFERDTVTGLPKEKLVEVVETLAVQVVGVNDHSLISDSDLEGFVRVARGLVPELRDISWLAVRDDLVTTVSLLIPDGLEYRFIHRYFGEYFAARFIARMPAVQRMRAFTGLRRDVARKRVVEFLAEMHPAMVDDELVLPELHREFGRFPKLKRRERMRQFIDRFAFVFEADSGNDITLTVYHREFGDFYTWMIQRMNKAPVADAFILDSTQRKWFMRLGESPRQAALLSAPLREALNRASFIEIQPAPNAYGWDLFALPEGSVTHSPRLLAAIEKPIAYAVDFFSDLFLTYRKTLLVSQQARVDVLAKILEWGK